ncbi:MAG: cytidylate kinase [Phycisphaeraceae bacterium]|nr:cytidylate kinase [Phycisphaeraceae bacterium]
MNTQTTITDDLIVTLDGPAGSGKSTVARQLAKRLGVDFLDTGAMYRGITALCLHHDVDPSTQADEALAIARQSDLQFDWQTDPPALYGQGIDLTGRLRDADVTSQVSAIAALGPVREILVDAQRKIGKAHPRLVTEGRDQGSVVFPNAQVKFYLDASAQVRAHRRAEQLRQAGKEADEKLICEQIIERDHKDSTRKDGPLICPDDAVKVDTSQMTLDQVVDHLYQAVMQRLARV